MEGGKSSAKIIQFPAQKRRDSNVRDAFEELARVIADAPVESAAPVIKRAKAPAKKAKQSTTSSALNERPNLQIDVVRGTTNIIGNHGAVNVLQVQRPPTVRKIIQTGEKHITQEQRVELHALKDEWVALHDVIKKRPLSHSSAWKRINASAGATTYREIEQHRFSDAVTFVKKEMAILRNMKSAPAKDESWRAAKIGAIKARCKNQFSGVDIYKPYISKKFGASSLTELATDELQKTYAYVMAKKNGG